MYDRTNYVSDGVPVQPLFVYNKHNLFPTKKRISGQIIHPWIFGYPRIIHPWESYPTKDYPPKLENHKREDSWFLRVF